MHKNKGKQRGVISHFLYFLFKQGFLLQKCILKEIGFVGNKRLNSFNCLAKKLLNKKGTKANKKKKRKKGKSHK